MIFALLLAAAAPQTAIDAERAFAADSQKLGQWTAFRKYAAGEAIMFLPGPGNAQAWLKDKKNPPVSVFWWPGRSYVSCDGTIAVNTGPWVREWGKSVGYFTTVCQRQPTGSWKWLLDHGDALKAARAEGGDIKAERAACPKAPLPPRFLDAVPRTVKYGFGSSTDGTLKWEWTVLPDRRRIFRASLWDGRQFKVVIEDKVAAE
jgi:hypothetical protein